MSTNTELLYQDFPVGYAEQNAVNEEDPVFYVEWLEDTSEFPSLSSSNDGADGNWELLQRKYIDMDECTLISVENNDWSKINTSITHELYSNITEKNAAELQPTKRAIQSLWPKNNERKTTKSVCIEDNDNYEEELGLELNDNYKSQSNRTQRFTKRRQLHQLKILDQHVDGMLKLATSDQNKSEVTWVPYEKDLSRVDQSKKMTLDKYVLELANFKVTNKTQAIIFSEKFSHNVKRYLYKYDLGNAVAKRSYYPDNSEFSVHATIINK